MSINNLDQFLAAKHSTYIISRVAWNIGGYSFPQATMLFPFSRQNVTAYRDNCLGTFTWSNQGFPNPLPVSAKDGLVLSGQVSGTFTIPDPTPGTNKYFCGLSTMNLNATCSLIDVLLIATGFTTTTTGGWTNFDTKNLPARDHTGGINGYGVKVALANFNSSSVAIYNAFREPYLLRYTNSDGISFRTGYIDYPNTNTAGGNTSAFVPFTLDDGCKGVKQINSVYTPTGTNVNFGLVMYRELARFSPAESNNFTYTNNNFESVGLIQVYSGSSFAFYSDNSYYSLYLTQAILKFAEG